MTGLNTLVALPIPNYQEQSGCTTDMTGKTADAIHPYKVEGKANRLG